MRCRAQMNYERIFGGDLSNSIMYHTMKSPIRHAPTGAKPVRNCVILCSFVLIIIGGQGSLKYDWLRQIDCPCMRARKQDYTCWSDSLHRELCQSVSLPRHVDCGRVIHDGASTYTYVYSCPCISICTYLTAKWSLCCIQWQVCKQLHDGLPAAHVLFDDLFICA